MLKQFKAPKSLKSLNSLSLPGSVNLTHSLSWTNPLRELKRLNVRSSSCPSTDILKVPKEKNEKGDDLMSTACPQLPGTIIRINIPAGAVINLLNLIEVSSPGGICLIVRIPLFGGAVGTAGTAVPIWNRLFNL